MSWVLSSWFRDGSSGFQSDLYSYELRGFFLHLPNTCADGVHGYRGACPVKFGARAPTAGMKRGEGLG